MVFLDDECHIFYKRIAQKAFFVPVVNYMTYGYILGYFQL